MLGSLLATKYSCPASALDLVPRPQVARLLDAGLRGRLILISAPAGFGKTTLVTQWLLETPTVSDAGHTPLPAAWLSLDAGDNALLRFWAYAVAALQTAVPTLGRVAQAAFEAPHALPIEPVLMTLMNDLVAHTPPLLLILDNYQAITEPAIHRSIDLLIEHAPPSLCLVIITREDPPLALARLRARGQLTEIRAADLRFTAAEAAAFLNTREALALPDSDIATLVQRTEGWITGLQLAALSLRDTSDRHGFVAAFSASDRFLTDYLVDEVLSRQPAHRTAFLLQTSVLERLCGSLCDAVLGLAPTEPASDLAVFPPPGVSHQRGSYSQPILDALDRANLFLVPLDHERRWFRYHHLFAEFLRLRLHEAEPAQVSALYRRAAAWCMAHGLEREALGYALAAGDHRTAADLLEARLPDSPGREAPDETLRWLHALPASLIQQRPLLCVQFAWALMFAGRMAEAAEYLAAAERSADTELLRQIAGQVAAHRAYLHFFAGEFTAAHQEAQQALSLLPSGETMLRARAAVVLSTVLRLHGQLPAAEAALRPLRDRIATASVYTATLYYATLGEIQQERGQLHQALATFEQALAFATRATGRPDTPFTGFAYIAISHVQRAWNDLEAATAAIRRGLDLCRAWQQADVLAIGLIELAELEQCRGQFVLAQQALDELRQIVATMDSPWGRAQVQVSQARLDLARGDLDAVEHWVRTSGVNAETRATGTGLDNLQTFGQVLIARGDNIAAARLFARMAEQFRTTGCVERLLPALVWQARALAELGQRTEALAVLAEALACGKSGGYVCVFVAGGPPVAALLGRMQNDDGEMNRFIAQLLSAFQPSPRPDLQPAPQHPLPEPLNDRELAILRLMAAGLSNQAIAAELSLSVNTIRWYASQIFAKLAVRGRVAAVACARELALLP